MKRLVAQAMEEGAMGLSTALLEPPSSLATTDNLIELAKVAKQYGGIYSSHIRDEGEGVFQRHRRGHPGREGREHPVDILHMKIAHKKLWGRVNEIIAMVQKARDEGHASGERLSLHGRAEQSVLDHSALGARRRPRKDAGAPARSRRAQAHARRNPQRAAELVQPLPGDRRRLGGMILVSMQSERNKPFQGKRMSELIAARGGDPVDVLFDVLRRGRGQRADGVLPSLRAGHAAGAEAAMDVDRIRWQPP